MARKVEPHCPECQHCQAKAGRPPTGTPVVQRMAWKRPWEHPGYASDGKITSIVDWFDGEWAGSRAKSHGEGDTPPPQINDQASWTEGFEEGWRVAIPYREARERPGG